ncbi:response regulator transcription factor [Dictyobacter arantiisoli]|uniref:DNA-binding response regulator n=1 Tax=Dictyobacter arantiisoli TaxID=2014874 RepID=A0A5A5TES3_9CHLR|nr:response regulator transcription factor [Dictyobacter arantiisoli]GCF10060.1 DNA-binding response regulator [Dictyobacter arantiisoli]
MAKILVVEDEVDICNLLYNALKAEGHTVFQAFDGEAALETVTTHTPQLIILDWMLPKLDGLSVCRRVRQNYLIPIIMLTARTEEVDRILGLEVGADDYISKPFSIREVTARVRAMLRRVELDNQMHSITTSTPQPPQPAPPLSSQVPELAVSVAPIICGPLRIQLTEHVVSLHNAELNLTPREYDLLVLFTSHPGRAFSRDFLLQQIWGYDYDGFDRTVDTHITRLRKKLGPLGDKITTVWGIGYRFTIS